MEKQEVYEAEVSNPQALKELELMLGRELWITETDGGRRVDPRTLAMGLFYWAEIKELLDVTADVLGECILHEQATVTAGDVRATYSTPRNRYDYKAPINAILAGEDRLLASELRVVIQDHTREVIDHRAVCKVTGIEPIVTPGEGPGSVTLKLLK